MRLFFFASIIFTQLASILFGSQETYADWIKFAGFKPLLAATDVIAIVQFEPNSCVEFQVVELLYPRKADINKVFAAYDGTFYGMLDVYYSTNSSMAILPGKKCLLFLKNLKPPGGRRELCTSRLFMLPSYANSYGLVDKFHSAIPLFDIDVENANAAPSDRKEEKTIELYVKKPLLDAYGTLDSKEILEGVSGVVKIASTVADLSDNKVFNKISDAVMDGGKPWADILKYPRLPDYASMEPPARVQDCSALRNSYLKELTIEGYKAEEVPFLKALELLEKLIHEKPGYESVRFVVEDKLKDELRQSESLVNTNIPKAKASEIMEVITFGMHVDIGEDKTIYIGRL